MKKYIAKYILYFGLATLLILGYLISNPYQMVFRLLGIIICAIGTLLFVIFSKVRRR